MSRFAKAPVHLRLAEEARRAPKSVLPFGIPYLDCATGGILPDDLVVLTARTGSGKSEMATLISQACLKAGKKVTLFALEAYQGEIESRLKFKMLAEAFYSQHDWKRIGRVPNYLDWRRGLNSDLVDKFDLEVDEEFSKRYSELYTCYRKGSFTPEDFEDELSWVWDFTDLIILDHLHYFDFDQDNENASVKATVKKIRELSERMKKPIILIAHLRKKDRGLRSIVPDVEEIHGSSDIPKIATVVVSAAPAFDQPQPNNHIFPTYLRVCKCRDDSSRTRYVGLSGYNIRGNMYEDNFQLGKLSLDETKFEEVRGEWPHWSRRGQ